MSLRKLSDMRPGADYRLSHYECPESDFARKLIAMGFVEGTGVVRSRTGLRDPLVFSIRNVRIAIRRKEAEGIYVSPAPGEGGEEEG